MTYAQIARRCRVDAARSHRARATAAEIGRLVFDCFNVELTGDDEDDETNRQAFLRRVESLLEADRAARIEQAARAVIETHTPAPGDYLAESIAALRKALG
jgi:uncharacterized protein (DUF2267 family)